MDADLRYANLGEANLEGANLAGANVAGAQFERANLTGVDLSRTIRIDRPAVPVVRSIGCLTLEAIEASRSPQRSAGGLLFGHRTLFETLHSNAAPRKQRRSSKTIPHKNQSEGNDN